MNCDTELLHSSCSYWIQWRIFKAWQLCKITSFNNWSHWVGTRASDFIFSDLHTRSRSATQNIEGILRNMTTMIAPIFPLWHWNKVPNMEESFATLLYKALVKCQKARALIWNSRCTFTALLFWPPRLHGWIRGTEIERLYGLPKYDPRPHPGNPLTDNSQCSGDPLHSGPGVYEAQPSLLC